MKIKYIIIFIILLILGNVIRLSIENSQNEKIEINEELNYNKETAKENSNFSKDNKKFDINEISYENLIKLGFNKSKATKLINFREKMGIILNSDEIKNIPKFGEKSFKDTKKYLFIDEIKITNPEKNYGKKIVKFNINNLDEEEFKLLGFSKKEINNIQFYLENRKIRSNIELEKIIGIKRYNALESRIKYSDE